MDSGSAKPRFISEPLRPSAEFVDTGALSRGEPPLPREFHRGDELLAIDGIIKTWRSTNTDRGDVYLARHWYEVRLHDGRIGVIYFDRKARGERPRWWLYTITGESDSPRERSSQ